MKSLTIYSDKELIEKYVAGDTEAFSTLIYKHKDRIYTSIYLLVKDKYQAEDIFQDTFIKIIDTIKAGKYCDEGKFLHWAIRIGHNLCVDHFRKIKRLPVIKNSEDIDIFDTLNFAEPGADYGIMKRESHSTLRKMLDMISDEQREVIVMRHYANLSFKDIAKLTDCSINTVLGRMRYGLINLRKLMAENNVAV